MQRILIIRFSSIGDIVLTSPVIRLLRKKFPSAHIRFVTKIQFKGLVENDPNLSGVHVLDNSLGQLVKELKRFDPDLVVDLHHNLRTRIMKAQLGGTWRSFKKLNVEKWLKVKMKVDRLPQQHIVDRYLETVAEFGIENDGLGLGFFFPSGFESPQIPDVLKAGFVTIVVGAKFKTKQLPAHKLIDVCNGIGKPILLIGGPEDEELASHVLSNCQGTVVNGCGNYSIHQSAWMIRESDLVITHDTGMMHIAAAFNKKVISVWGNTIPEFGMSPYLPNNEDYMSEVKGLSCRPCSKIGYNKCPKGHFRCMEEQNISAIIDSSNKT